MNTERIRKRLINGFRPFAIHLSSGRKFVVPYPEFIMVGKSVVAVLGNDDSVTTIDALHIVAVEDLPRKHRKPTKS
ncbi:MAG: hypothetical protein FJ398_06290 [Verrucomicrobia bacterium]|nr:hypothetical protein [Verrucomicrobiota bacterium]